MHDEKAAPVRRFVQCLEADLDVAEHQPVVIAERPVVIAGNVDDPRAVLGLAENRADDVVMRLRPVETARQAPHVDDVADEVDLLALDAAQEVEQEFRAASLETKMDVGDEDATESQRGSRRRHLVHVTSPSAALLGANTARRS